MSSKASTSTKHKKVKKGKKSSAVAAEPDVAGKNEGVDANWAFQPPDGVKVIHNAEVDNGAFDWDNINDDEDLELWAIRLPDNVKPKHLEGVSLDVPIQSSSRGKGGTTRVGILARNHQKYDIWSLGDDNLSDNPTPNDQAYTIGGEEMKSFSCLLPRKNKKGKLYPAPRPIARHVVLSTRPPEQMNDTDTPTNLTNPPRHRYPPELLTHRFQPYGSSITTPHEHKSHRENDDEEEDLVMIEVDNNLPLETQPLPSTQPDTVAIAVGKSKSKKKRVDEDEDIEEVLIVKEKKKKSKKRKGEDIIEASSSKKSKKAKVVV